MRLLALLLFALPALGQDVTVTRPDGTKVTVKDQSAGFQRLAPQAPSVRETSPVVKKVTTTTEYRVAASCPSCPVQAAPVRVVYMQAPPVMYAAPAAAVKVRRTPVRTLLFGR